MDFIPDLVTEPISRDPQHWGYLALSCLVTIDASAGEIRVPSRVVEVWITIRVSSYLQWAPSILGQIRGGLP